MIHLYQWRAMDEWKEHKFRSLSSLGTFELLSVSRNVDWNRVGKEFSKIVCIRKLKSNSKLKKSKKVGVKEKKKEKFILFFLYSRRFVVQKLLGYSFENLLGSCDDFYLAVISLHMYIFCIFRFDFWSFFWRRWLSWVFHLTGTTWSITLCRPWARRAWSTSSLWFTTSLRGWGFRAPCTVSFFRIFFRFFFRFFFPPLNGVQYFKKMRVWVFYLCICCT